MTTQWNSCSVRRSRVERSSTKKRVSGSSEASATRCCVGVDADDGVPQAGQLARDAAEAAPGIQHPRRRRDQPGDEACLAVDVLAGRLEVEEPAAVRRRRLGAALQGRPARRGRRVRGVHRPHVGSLASARSQASKECSVGRERAGGDLGRVGAGGILEVTTQVGVLLDEPRRAAPAQAGHVLPHEHLRVAVRARADADGRDAQRLGDLRRDRRRDHLHDDREAARGLEREGVLDAACRRPSRGPAPCTHRARARSAG